MSTCPHCGGSLDSLEVWRPIKGFEGWYEVSNYGRVRRVGKGKASRSGRILKPTLNGAGYPTVWLSLPNPQRRFARMVHLLVAHTFIGPPMRREVNHKDTKKDNPALTNLEYTTRKQNSAHAKQHGLYQRGTDRYNSLLTEDSVREIRKEYAETQVMQKDLAKKHGVSSGAIQALLSGKTWAWL